MSSPFPPSVSVAGTGNVYLALQPPNHPTFLALSYSYPLKLIVSAHHTLSSPEREKEGANDSATEPLWQPSITASSVPLLFMLTYGGGLLAGDKITLSITLDPAARLAIATQGSTKIFAPPTSSPSSAAPPLSSQALQVSLAPHSALWLAPDPCQPFAGSHYAQTQIFELEKGASLGLVDWVCEGRRARGESWAFERWRGRNELWNLNTAPSGQYEDGERKQGKRLMLRDSLVLSNPDLKARTDGLGLFGTLILAGPLFSSLSSFLLQEFAALPRIGARDWSHGETSTASEEPTGAKEMDAAKRFEEWRKRRQETEVRDGVLWTAAKVRGCTVVKFGAREVEGGKGWLGAMLKEEGSVGREFGPGGMMCVR